MKTAYVNVTENNKIAEIEFYSPASNSLNSVQLSQLTSAIKEVGTREKVSVIHLKSAGDRVFCAGASFDELLTIDDLEKGEAFFMGFANVVNAIRTCGKIVVTSIQGKTVGGGVGIAAASDYVLASSFASVKLSELSICIGPFVIETAVTRALGMAKFSELALNPKGWKSAEWAQQNGLYQEVCEDYEVLKQRAKAYLEELSGYSAEALKEMKKVLWQGTEDWDVLLKERAAVSGKLVLTDETKAVLTSFKSK